MDLKKQISEMSKIIQEGELARNRGDIDCSEFPTDLVIKVGLQRLAGAKALYNAGYRKASEVAEEIFEELKKVMIDEYRYPVIAELEKKYTKSDSTQAVYKHRTPNGATYITSEPISSESEVVHYVIINEWELDDQCESGIEVMGGYHTEEEAIEAFKTFVQGERNLADSRGWEVYEDKCNRHDAGALGFYANEHSVLFIAKVK